MPLPDVPDYRVATSYGADPIVLDDPYRFLPTLGEVDLHLINEGRHEQLWEVLGAHVRHYPGALEPVTGTSFAVWAPSARAVRIKADFNSWDGREHPMRQLGTLRRLGALRPGRRQRHGVQVRDPGPRRRVAREGRPDGGLGREARRHGLEDLRVRATSGATTPGSPSGPRRSPVDGPMSVYEMHLGSWKKHHDGRYWSWAELADELPAYVAGLGFTHVELMPVMQHPFGGSWGYHVTSYFAPDSRFGDPDGFRLLVDRLHQAGVGVILDWVPGHFATDEWALARFDGTPALRGPQPAARLAQGVGLPHLQLRPSGGAQLPLRQRGLLARGVPRRRAARRRRRVDALPRLRPRGRRVVAQHPRRATRTSRPCSSSRR